MGYCPTMEPYALEFSEEFELIKLSNTAEVLKNLNKGLIDVGLVGWLAKDFEILNVREIRLRDGYTLVSENRGLIDYNKLKEYTIHTSINESEARNFLGDEFEIIFYNSLEEIPQDNLILINWDNITGNHKLVIPMIGENKVEKFRIPTIYYFEYRKNLDSFFANTNLK